MNLGFRTFGFGADAWDCSRVWMFISCNCRLYMYSLSERKVMRFLRKQDRAFERKVVWLLRDLVARLVVHFRWQFKAGAVFPS